MVGDRIQEIIQNKNAVKPIELKMIREDGVILDAEVISFPLLYEGEFAIKTIITDISHRKKAEQLLVDTRQQYFTLVENLSDVVFQTDTDAQLIYLNASWEN